MPWFASLLVVLVATTPLVVTAEDWPQFRGPGGQGLSAATGLPTTWSASENIRWKVATPGRGRSSPVVLGDRIWLTTAHETLATPEDAKRRVAGNSMAHELYVLSRLTLSAVCLDRHSGKQIYESEIFTLENPDPVHTLNSYATPTPVVDAERLYCDFGTFGTACLDASTGKVLWKRRLPIDHQVGPGSSPALEKDLLLLVRDGCDQQYIAALDCRTGRTVWKTARPPLEGVASDQKKAYSTPLVIEAVGRRQIIVPGAQWIVAYDPLSGKPIWQVHHGRGFSLAPRPVYGHGMVYVCTGCMVAELWAIRVDGHGDVTKSHVAWKATSQIPILSSPLLVGDEIYTVSDSGIMTCLDAATGKLQWKHRIPGKYAASPLYADGRIYCFNEDGVTTVVQTGKHFVQLAENQLDGPLIASPAIAGRNLLLRTDKYLYCVGAGQGGKD